MDLVLNYLQRLICHKTQPTNQPTNKRKPFLFGFICLMLYRVIQLSLIFSNLVLVPYLDCPTVLGCHLFSSVSCGLFLTTTLCKLTFHSDNHLLYVKVLFHIFTVFFTFYFRLVTTECWLLFITGSQDLLSSCLTNLILPNIRDPTHLFRELHDKDT